jgi:hypothetical protein
MNPLSSKNLNGARTDQSAINKKAEVDLTFSLAAFCEFSSWVDQELEALEFRFEDFITRRSKKHSFGR